MKKPIGDDKAPQKIIKKNLALSFIQTSSEEKKTTTPKPWKPETKVNFKKIPFANNVSGLITANRIEKKVGKKKSDDLDQTNVRKVSSIVEVE